MASIHQQQVAAASSNCYCAGPTTTLMFRCTKCTKLFHSECLRSGPPSPLIGDTLFHFVCTNCSDDGCERFSRMRLHWIQVVLLTLYNLQLHGGGKCGYYRWRENICTFIEKHWTTFFGPTRKKTSTWHGTVAGTLSTGCPQYFQSGAQELKESGWWALVNPNALDLLLSELSNQDKRAKSTAKVDCDSSKAFGTSPQSTKVSSGTASTSVNEPRNSPSRVSKKIGSGKSSAWLVASDSDISQTQMESDGMADEANSNKSSVDWNVCDDSAESWFTEKDLKPEETVPQLLLKDETVDLEELEIDPCCSSPLLCPNSPKVEELMHFLEGESKSHSDPRMSSLDIEQVDPVTNFKFVKRETSFGTCDSEHESTDASEINQLLEFDDSAHVRKKQRVGDVKNSEEPEKEMLLRHLPLSIYEEHALLEKLQCFNWATEHCPQARLLRRKLLVRKAKRERNLLVFNLDNEFLKLKGVSYYQKNEGPYSFGHCQERRVLDRYQTELRTHQVRDGYHASFLTRLIGRDEHQLDNIISPYTARVLKPFIWRDYETVPPKLKLLQEILAYTHREDKSWNEGPRHPIDYCYVQPKHIPSVNAFCREFFWPGIDLSECLQYPDFSCVVMYRKMVIGFSFMVPDVKCNEAYITFVFTHPEWRNAGIGTFMIYHLIQTCMGKDVTLHVSATNPAIVLYQKFGFKMEEFVLDFYDKYYPEGSMECKHSFFLRLSH